MKTKDKVQAFMEEQNMVQKGDHVLIGLSGGADSVCLLHILMELQNAYDLTLTAVHVEHGIRGEEALEDAAFVEKMCEKYKVACYVRHFSVPELAKNGGISLEEMGRTLRYETFSEIAREVGASRIATAHHENDVAETMLFNLCRGTGLAGLCALLPVRGNRIRPLLCLSREEIEAYLQERQIAYREDSTNRELQYTRNYIRQEIVPRLKKINPKAVEHLNQTSQMLAKANEVLEGQVFLGKKEFVQKKERGVLVRRELFFKQPEYLITAILQNVMGELAGSKKDIQGVHVKALVNLRTLQVGKKIDLPYNIQASREYEGIYILNKGVEREESYDFCIPLQVPGETYLPGGEVIETKVFSLEDKNKIPYKTYTKWFDYDIINESLQVRTRQMGDYMVVDEHGGRKKIKDLLINEKVPREARDRLPLITSGQLILWAVGVRMGEYGKITPKTKQVLEINIHGGKNHE